MNSKSIKFIFSISYLNKDKLNVLKKAFLVNENYSLSFLTRSNFHMHFDSKFLKLKAILYGKYLIINDNHIINDYNDFKNNISKIKLIIESLELELQIFLITTNSFIYSYDFLKKSEKYNIINLFNIIKFNNILNNYNFLLYNYIIYNKLLLSINNTLKIHNLLNTLISYIW